MDPTVAYPLLFVVGSGINTATLAANYTVDTAVADTTSPIFHSLVASGSDREFILPNPSASLIGLAYVLSNAGTSGGYSWLAKGKTLTTTGTLSSASTIGTVAPGESCYMICYFDGTYYRWKYQVIGATSGAFSGSISAIGAALTGPITFKDASTPTKILSFAMSAITGGQTRTLTMADFDVNLNTGPFTENTDVVIPVSTISFTAVADVWTRSRSAAADYKIARNAGASVGVLAVEVPTLVLRSTASKGRKITGLKIKYAIATAAANDVTVSVGYTVVPANASAVAAASNLGSITYDANHDTSAKRKTVAEHTMQVTFGSPVYLADAVGFEILITVDAALTTDFSVSQIELLASEALIDAT